MKYMVDLNEFADGKLAHRFNEELQKVLENVADPNTEPHKNRTITITVNIHGDDNRDVLNTDVVVKSKMQHAKPASTKLMMGVDNHNNMICNELKSGVKNQMFIDVDGDVAHDTGEKVEQADDRVVDLRKTLNK